MPKSNSPTRFINTVSLASIISYTLPLLRINKGNWYVEFYAYDPLLQKQRRKRIKVNRVKSIKSRRQYASGLIARLTQQLQLGWNPWIEQDCENMLPFSEVTEKYINNLNRQYQDKLYRQATYDNYSTMIRRLIEYNNHREQPIYYLYQLDIRFCNDYLEYIYIHLELSAQYRNNCLTFLKMFCRWCIQKGYMQINPAAEIPSISKKLCAKKRETIPAAELVRIREYLHENDKYFLLSCYLLYYCCIRPSEQMQLRISDINRDDCTLTIKGEVSKNKNTQTVTLPRKVMLLIEELKILSSPLSHYIFSSGLMPGEKNISRRMLGKHWEKMKKELKLKDEYQLYSLKDSGITDMLQKKVSNIAVRDQARHSSLSITNIYARAINKSANEEILEVEGDF